MEWRKTSNHLIGATIKKDIFSLTGNIVMKKNSKLNEQMIDYLITIGIDRVFVSITELENETEFQLEGFIQKSEQPLFWESYLSLVSEIKTFFALLKKQIYNPSEIKILTESLFTTISLLHSKKEFFDYIYQFKGHEDSLYRHSANVSIISYLLAQKLNEKPSLLAEMGLFHDIGKSTLSTSILNKPARLDDKEKGYVETHTTTGAELLKKLSYDSKELLQAALLHHEYRDGSGYPNKYSSENIPFQIQILTVVDTFDSIRSDRIYKEGKKPYKSLEELYEESLNGKLNPLIVTTFSELYLSIFQDKPVQLNNGQKATIFYINPTDILNPIVELEGGEKVNLSLENNIKIVEFINKTDAVEN